MTKTAVLYARYSSSKQREVSIDDQLRVNREFLSREGIKEVGVYIDRAKSGRTDRRQDFRRMIANAPESDYVVVYAMDRFSRDRWDAPAYKKILADAGVRVISATERIDDSPEGVLMEKVLEGQAAWYSLSLARNVTRGMTGNAEQCKSNGYKLLGYDVDPLTRHYIINEAEAEVVRTIFSQYIGGATINSIAEKLAQAGYKTRNSRPMSYNAVQHILHNERYTGVYRWGDVVKPGGMPAIISRPTFDAAQDAARKRNRKREETYVFDEFILTGKLFCGMCGGPMRGTSGHGRHGKKYLYYKCVHGDRKPIRKEIVEDALAEAVLQLMDEPATARMVAERIVASYVGDGKVDTALQACEANIRECEKGIANIEKGVEQGIVTPGLSARLAELQGQLERHHAERGRLLSEKMDLDVDSLTEFLQHGFDQADDDLVFNGFVNRVYLFDDYMVATMNYRDETNDLAEVRIALEETEKSNPRAKGFDQNGDGGA